METDARQWIRALRASHDALIAQVMGLAPAQLVVGSYCRDWDVAQVLSHLGSGAEIGLVGLERTLAHAAPLGREDFPAIWDRWNALDPIDKASEMVVWDRRYVSVLQGLDDAALESLHMNLFGMDLDAVAIVGLRLNEHALHSWDVAVKFDPVAEVRPSSVELLVDRVPLLIGWLGKPDKATTRGLLEIRTSDPARQFFLSLGESVALSKDPDGQPVGVLELPAAALLRLVNGRLDPGHTPAGTRTEGQADLDELRQVFPGP
jgi:uncharacterized protein (TIGR03083 family)